MKKQRTYEWGKIIGMIAAILIIGFLLLFFCYLLYFFIFLLPSLDPIAGTTFLAAIMAFVGVFYTQWQIKSRDIFEKHRESKIDVYTTYLEIRELIASDDNMEVINNAKDEQELPKNLPTLLKKLRRGLILWGSPNVINAHLKVFSMKKGATGFEQLKAMDDLYLAIRKDLGNSNKGLKSGDLTKLELKDPYEWDENARNANKV